MSLNLNSHPPDSFAPPQTSERIVMNTRKRGVLGYVFAGLCVTLAVSCLPAELEKYREQSGAKHSESLATDSLLSSGPRLEGNGGQPSPSKHLERSSVGSREAKRVGPFTETAGVYAVDGQTYRIVARDDDVWDATIDVLLKHYTLTVVDRSSGIISTEWDTYMRANTAYRNKLTLRVRKSGRASVDLTIRNSIERLRGAHEAGGMLGAIWLPSDDPSQETRRIVQNVAILLNLPPPVFPPEGQDAHHRLSAKDM